VCKGELASSYRHCLGCEWLRDKDWNVCDQCFRAGKHLCDNGDGHVCRRRRP
jgi:hypothetical protein